jgi:hypothetical protein
MGCVGVVLVLASSTVSATVSYVAPGGTDASQPSQQDDAGLQHFITRKDNKLYDGEKAFRFVGANMPGLTLPYDWTLYLPERLHLPTPWEQEDGFKTLDQMNLRVVRLWNLPIREPHDKPTAGSKTWHYVQGPGLFNEESFKVIDHMLALANKYRVRVIFPFTAEWGDYLGGIGTYAAHRGKERLAFYTDPQVRNDYKATLHYILTRTNTVTGVPYRDDKAILAWQFGNEMDNAPDEWLSVMAAYIKSLDANHLVAETRYTPKYPHVIDPNIDLHNRHYYGGSATSWLEACRKEVASLKGQRPFFVGEFGPYIDGKKLTHGNVVDQVRKFLEGVQAQEGMAGTCLWSMYFRHQEGGFYWHQIMTFPAVWSYHSPGFPSADAQREIGLMGIMREAGFKIQGLPVPPVPVPEAPHLLPISEVPMFSWRGSVGAIGYDIQRAEQNNGPWTTIAQNVSDADIAYRPLFSDTTAVSGQSYSYRIIARNQSGASQPSNVVGPIQVKRVCLADELQDFSRAFAKSSGLKLNNDYNALYAEYLFRAQGSTNDWITYQVPAMIESVKVTGFYSKQAADFELRVSSDGNTFTALKPERKERRLPSPPGGAAGGQRRTLVEYECVVPAGQCYLQVAWSGPAELDRVEIYYRCAAHAAEPLSVSGIYPHLTVFNSDPKREKPEPECGLGAVVPWAGKLWSTTYTSHALGRGSDKLFAVLPDLSLEIRPESVGGTSACRMIHRESKQLFIASYVIDEAGKVRVIPRDKLPGRLTALARHLTDPANKVLYLTQEGAVYEVDVHSLAVTEMFKKPLPGWHYKGAWTAQGRFFVAANGEEPAPSPFWKVDYTSAATKFEAEKLTWPYLQTPYQPLAAPRKTGQTLWKGLSEDMGNLGEWDGKTWSILSRRQHLDISGPGGLTGATSDEQPVWALGWDLRSAFIKVREKSGSWTTYRLPKSSYSADGMHGSNTEWPRICDVGDGPRLMFLHNGLYELPVGFRNNQSGGLRHLGSTLVTVTDMTTWNGKLVFSQQATSVHGIPALVPGQPHSNLQFLQRSDLPTWGPAEAHGGVWVEDAVKANTPSDAILIGGYEQRCLQLVNHSDAAVTFTIEMDAEGDGQWKELITRQFPTRGNAPLILPANLKAQWLRVKSDTDCVATAFLHVSAPRHSSPNEARIFNGLASASESAASIGGIVRAGFPSAKLQFLTRDGRYFEVDETLAFQAVEATNEVAKLQATHALTNAFTEDAASIIVTRYDGLRFRLPKGDEALSTAPASRGVRECIQERYLANYHGTFYEVPRGATSPAGVRNLPDFQRMKPVATHNKPIADFCVWRGMLVLSGVKTDAANDGHVFGNADAKLWFGAIDDLWKMGKPVGRGGPWKDSSVQAGEPSDAYLMTGYDKKTLTLAHDARQPVEFIVEVDFYADGQWHEYQRLTVAPGQPLVYDFPVGYAAHWLRVQANTACRATAQLNYR